jgi:hypothetical protein
MMTLLEARMEHMETAKRIASSSAIMRPMFMRLFASFPACIFAMLMSLSIANGQSIESANIRAGTLARLVSPKVGFVFQPGVGAEEVFEDTGILSTNEGPPRLSLIPDLPWVGFKLDNGVEYHFKTESGFQNELELAQRANKEHPGHKITALLFTNLANRQMEILIEGKTPVYRLDMKIRGRDITIWIPKKVSEPSK